MSDSILTEAFFDPIIRSLIVAVMATCVVAVTGTIIGHFLSRVKIKGKIIIETLLMMPLVLPPSVVGFGLLIIFGRQSPIGEFVEWVFNQPIVFSIWGAILASIVVAFPLMYQTSKNGFLNVDSTVREAAAIDGANGFQTFFFIDLRLAKNALLTGALLAFARSIGEFGATLMIAGNIPGQTQTMPTAIYIAVETNQLAKAWGWVASTVIISFILLFVVYSMGRNRSE